MSSTEWLGCNIEPFYQHIEQQFTEGMSWENYDEWHIDHKIPLKYNKSSLEEVAQRQHYTNVPMWASKNMSTAANIFLADPDHFSFLAGPEQTKIIKKAWETVYQNYLDTHA